MEFILESSSKKECPGSKVNYTFIWIYKGLYDLPSNVTLWYGALKGMTAMVGSLMKAMLGLAY